MVPTVRATWPRAASVMEPLPDPCARLSLEHKDKLPRDDQNLTLRARSLDSNSAPVALPASVSLIIHSCAFPEPLGKIRRGSGRHPQASCSEDGLGYSLLACL